MAPILPILEEHKDRPIWEEVSSGPPVLKMYWAQWPLLAVREGVLYRKWESDDGKQSRWLIVLPRTLRSKVLQELHDDNTAGHPGGRKTLQKVCLRYYWARMAIDVQAHIRHRCKGGRERKKPTKQRKTPSRQYQGRTFKLANSYGYCRRPGSRD